jgi:hypothetical protein
MAGGKNGTDLDWSLKKLLLLSSKNLAQKLVCK